MYKFKYYLFKQHIYIHANLIFGKTAEMDKLYLQIYWKIETVLKFVPKGSNLDIL